MPSSPSIFREQPPTISLPAFDYSAGYIDSIKDINAPENSLTGGQNVEINLSGKPSTRGGTALYNQFLGSSTDITGLFNVLDNQDNQERLAVYNTGIQRDVSGQWTPLTGVTMTAGLPCDGVYFPVTNKFYITNGTDNVVKYQTGNQSADQTDGTFKKGKYITVFQDTFLVGNVPGQPNYLWWSDTGLETFEANNFAIMPEPINGLFAYYDKVLIFTKRTIQVITNFVYNSTYQAPQNITQLPTNFGAIYERTVALVNGYVYFVGQDSRKKVEIYKTDGMQVTSVGDPLVRNFLNSLSAAQLNSACATFDGVYYRLAVADNGQTTNTTGIVFDTVRGIFFTPEKKFVQNISDYSCFMVSETNGQYQVYAGSSNLGQVYLLNQLGSYDELPEERYLTLGSFKLQVNANPAARAAQGFKMHNYVTSQLVSITQVSLYIATNSGTNTPLQVTIQTDNNGVPSGTVVTNGTASISTNSGTFSWQQAKFTIPPILKGSTQYWIVLQHVTEGTGNSKYYWLANPCTASYPYGYVATYSNGWAADQIANANFIVYAESYIDSFFLTKAFSLVKVLSPLQQLGDLPSTLSQRVMLQKFYALFSSVGSYNVQIGFTNGDFNSFQYFMFNLSGNMEDNTWGGGAHWGDGSVWGGSQARVGDWNKVTGFIGRLIKVKVRSFGANTPFSFDGMELVGSVKYRQT